MALDDYLAKHYGSASKKSKRSSRAPAATYGANVIVTDDDDSVRGASRAMGAAGKAAAPAKPRFKDASSSWHAVGQAATAADPIGELLDAAGGGEDGPAIAEGADLVREYQSQQRDKEEQEAVLRRERQRQQATQAAEQRATASAPARTSRSPSPGPMRYGLLTAATVKADADRAHEREVRRLRELGDEVSGRNAGTVYRDAKTGKQIDVEEAQRKVRDKALQHEQLRAQHAEWNKGLVQQREKLEEQRVVERMQQPGGEPDRRSELDAEQRARQHWNDPALQFLENKRPEKHTYPVYKGHAPPNRFGIRPGYRWDG
ncbi:Pre-mRNA-splicing factor cwc26, partial [Coemansia spiralis]